MRVNARIVASDSVCRCRLNRRFDEGKVPKVSFDFHTAVPPERVMAMLTDFSPNRPEIWPMLAPELYEVYRLDAGSASVKEGSTFPRRIWERDDYEWSADRVRWTLRWPVTSRGRKAPCAARASSRSSSRRRCVAAI